MATATPEPRYPLALTERQLRALTGYLDSVSTSEADPDAEVFALIDQVRQVRKQIATATAAPVIQIEQDNPDTLTRARETLADVAKATSEWRMEGDHGLSLGWISGLCREQVISPSMFQRLRDELNAARRTWREATDAASRDE